MRDSTHTPSFRRLPSSHNFSLKLLYLPLVTSLAVKKLDLSQIWRTALKCGCIITRVSMICFIRFSRKEDPTCRGELSFGGMGFSIECIVTSKFVRSDFF